MSSAANSTKKRRVIIIAASFNIFPREIYPIKSVDLSLSIIALPIFIHLMSNLMLSSENFGLVELSSVKIKVLYSFRCHLSCSAAVKDKTRAKIGLGALQCPCVPGPCKISTMSFGENSESSDLNGAISSSNIEVREYSVG